jgi:hypothetical protein
MSRSKSVPSRPEPDGTILIRLCVPIRLRSFISLRRAAVILLGFLVFHPLTQHDQGTATGTPTVTRSLPPYGSLEPFMQRMPASCPVMTSR